jgi:predicted dinucleotide-binding enzyme
VVKGWNHVFARHLAAPEVDGIATSVLLAGDDREAKQIVSALARGMGFHPVDVGPLRESYHLDRLVSMMLSSSSVRSACYRHRPDPWLEPACTARALA